MRFVADKFNVKALNSIKGIELNTRRGIRKAWFSIGKQLQSSASTAILKGPKTGRMYKPTGRSRRHRPSSPGESPANMTGSLRRSIGFVVQGADEMEFGAGVKYAAALELGYEKRNLEARPYLIRAINENNAEENFVREIRKELESK